MQQCKLAIPLWLIFLLLGLQYALQDSLNALHLAAIGNHVEVIRALVEECGLSVTHRDIVSCTLINVCSNIMVVCMQK